MLNMSSYLKTEAGKNYKEKVTIEETEPVFYYTILKKIR